MAMNDVFILVVLDSLPNDDWWHRRVQAPIQLETLSQVATHGLLAFLVWCVDDLRRINLLEIMPGA
jgi:hypothetical protein